MGNEVRAIKYGTTVNACARGLRPVQIWVPDTRTAKFSQEAHRQSLAVAKSTGAHADQAFIDAVSNEA